MDPGCFERQRHIETVVDHEVALMRFHKLLDLTCKSEEISCAEVPLPQLDRNPAGLQRLGKDRHQRPALGLLTIRDEEETGFKRSHERPEKYAGS
jgi:hypothetical protein